MEEYLLRCSRILIAGVMVTIIWPYTVALAATEEFITNYCTDYSVHRLIQEGSNDEMNLQDQYDLIDKYFTDCIIKKRAEIRKEAVYSTQPVFFN